MKDNRKVNERRFWEKRAINYDKRVKVFSDEYSSIIEQTKKYTHANSVVLDAACGTGIISLELAKYVRDIERIDISPNMIAVAKEKTKQNKIKNVNFSVGDTYELNFPDEHFDIILLANLLHVVKDPIAVVSEAKRVLKQEGILLLSVECSGEYQKKLFC